MQNLRSLGPSVVTRELRKLPLRWFHAKQPKMRFVLITKAGLDNVRLNLIKGVCDTCRVCRARGKLGHAVMPSTALPGKFSEEVDCDLMSYKHEHNRFHIIDRCVRYGAGSEIPDKNMTSILDAYHQCWMQF
eukprot:7948370-Pyramimonas_sp.AAC.1